MLCNLGFYGVWISQDTRKLSFDCIKTCIKDQFLQSWSTVLEKCSKLCIYKRYKLVFGFEKYLDFHCYVSILTKLRSGTLRLNVEVGRYLNTQRENRICICCNMNVLEDEYHFVLSCPAYRSVRIEFLPLFYCSWPNRHKLDNLLQANSKSLTVKLCNYLNAAWKIRSHILS